MSLRSQRFLPFALWARIDRLLDNAYQRTGYERNSLAGRLYRWW